MAPLHTSVRRQVADLREQMQTAHATPAQIAAQISARLRVTPAASWRLLRGLTQAQAAGRYNDRWEPDPPKTGKNISYWERWGGPGSPASMSARAPSHLDLTRLAELYECTVDDLLPGHGRGVGGVGPEPDARRAGPEYAGARRGAAGDPEEDATYRREMLKSMTAAGLAVAGLPAPRLAGIPDRVGPEQAEEVRRLTEMYRGWLYQHGASGQLQGGVARLLQHATSLVTRAFDSTTRQALLDVLANTAELAAYVCRDLGLHDHAQQHYVIALHAAQAAGNPALAGHTVVRMAGHQIEVAQPDRVLGYLDAARRIGRADSFTAGELSNQHAIQAWAYAQSGIAQNVHRAVGLAEEQAARTDDRGGPGWRVRHVTEAELYSLTGAGYATLAQHHPAHAREAIRRLTLALDLRGLEGARNATLDRISLAEAHLADRDLPEALTAARAAVTSATGSASRRVRVRLTELGHRFGPHTATTEIAELVAGINVLTAQRPAGR